MIELQLDEKEMFMSIQHSVLMPAHYRLKRELINSLKNAEILLITAPDVDHKKYHSNKHGLDANFLELIQYALKYEKPTKRKTTENNYTIKLKNIKISVENTAEMSIFYIKNKSNST